VSNCEPLQVFGRIREFELEANVAELDALGLTVIEPDVLRSHISWERLKTAVLQVSKARSDIEPDESGGTSHTGYPYSLQTMHYVLLDGAEFESALMNPLALAVADYMLGGDCRLSAMIGLVKGPHERDIPPLHCDAQLLDSPYPSFASVCNITYVLSDYNVGNGGLYYWPGSHKFCRPPNSDESHQRDRFMAVMARAGSLIVWHGNTWHGALARRTPGLRISLILYFCRHYLERQESYKSHISIEAINRNGRRFQDLIGLNSKFPISPEEGRGLSPKVF
jgi:hypothetical protein